MTHDPRDLRHAHTRISATARTRALAVAPAAHDHRPLLAEGELLASRYRIVRLIAQGGMGEVYEAADEALGERVALKTIRAAVARDPWAVEQFKREVQLARRVTHPNACRLFELGFHAPDPAAAPSLFLTMELLAGRTLADEITERGTLTTAEAAPLALQMIAALAAAHEAGVVHRDFKSANVMLVPEAQRGTRAVVTDFGLAHPPVEGGSGRPDTGEVMGSPSYMAPEQVSAQPVGPAADQYALGVVLYEMVTGRLPYEGDDPLEVARRRLTERAADPRTLVPSLDPGWAGTIMRCLALRPEDRFPAITDVGAALASAGGRGRSRWRAAAAAVLVLLTVTGAWLAVRRGGRSATPASASRVLAVMLRDGGSTPRWQTLHVADLLQARLASVAQLRLVPAADVARSRVELGLSDADTWAPETLARIRRNLGADRVISGSVAVAGREWRADVALQDARDGTVQSRVRETAPDAASLVDRLLAGLPAEMGAGNPAAIAALQPAREDALQAWLEGRALLWRFDLAGARVRLRAAAEAEPGSPAVHLALADLWSAFKSPESERDAARRAWETAATLPAEVRDPLEARHRAAAGEWERAIALYDAAFQRGPGLVRGLDLARAQAAAGQVVAARATLERLRELPEPERSDPRIDLADAEASYLDDPERASLAAARAVAAAEGRGARAILGDAHAALAGVAWVRADIAGLIEAAERAKGLHLAVGNRKQLAQDLNAIGVGRWSQGRLADAVAVTEEALAIQRELGEPGDTPVDLCNLGFMAIRRGRVAEARRRFAEGLALRAADDPMRGVALLGFAWADAVEGRLAEARRGYDAALATLGSTNEPYVRGFILVREGEARAAAGDLDGAHDRFQVALGLMGSIGMRTLIAEIHLARAAVLVEQGRPAEASALATAARDDMQGMGARNLQALAAALKARASLAAGDGAAAAAAIAEAQAVAPEHDDVLVALEAAIDAGRVSCAQQGRAAEARVALARARDEASRLGLKPLASRAAKAAAGCGR